MISIVCLLLGWLCLLLKWLIIVIVMLCRLSAGKVNDRYCVPVARLAVSVAEMNECYYVPVLVQNVSTGELNGYCAMQVESTGEWNGYCAMQVVSTGELSGYDAMQVVPTWKWMVIVQCRLCLLENEWLLCYAGCVYCWSCLVASRCESSPLDYPPREERKSWSSSQKERLTCKFLSLFWRVQHTGQVIHGFLGRVQYPGQVINIRGLGRVQYMGQVTQGFLGRVWKRGYTLKIFLFLLVLLESSLLCVLYTLVWKSGLPCIVLVRLFLVSALLVNSLLCVLFFCGSLVCSDAMARGMDLDNVKYVISYDNPPYIKTYIHRVGRTARAGRAGTAISLLEKKEVGVCSTVVGILMFLLPPLPPRIWFCTYKYFLLLLSFNGG